MSRLFNYSSVHNDSINPSLYLGLMISYMHKAMNKTCKLTKLRVSSDMLYKNITYPALSDAADDLYVLMISLIDDIQSIPDITLNASVIYWLKNIKLKSDGVMNGLINNSNLRIKYPRTDNIIAQERGLFEYFIGIIMNKLRKKMPYFVYTLGAFKCSSINIDTFCAFQENTVNHLIQEKVQGQNLDEWLQQTPNAKTFYIIILQLAFALQKAQDKMGFSHNALYASNVILRPSDISTVTFQFGSQVFQMMINREIPTIIDYSSSRVTHKGFGLCYLSNPTIFIPGRDLCKLISSCLARINKSELYGEVSWINEFFHDFYDVSKGSYDELVAKYSGFDLPQDSPMASKDPMDFINWFRNRNGELFNRLVTVRSREIKNLHFTQLKPQTEVDSSIKDIPSAVLKSYAFGEYGIKYTPTAEEKKYDAQMISSYPKYIASHLAKIYTINYNFPLRLQYDDKIRVDYEQILSQVQESYDVLSNYIVFIRYAKTVGMSGFISTKELQTIFSEKDKFKHNINVIRNLPLYRLYQIALAISLNMINGQVIVCFQDLYQAVDWVKRLYPVCIEYLDSVFLPNTVNIKVDNIPLVNIPRRALDVNHYYPPSTLDQFGQLINNKTSLLNLATKIFFDSDKSKSKLLEPVIFQAGADDVKILLDLHQFHTSVELDRGERRAKDMIKFLLPQLSSIKISTYLDFGGGDGSISSAIAKVFQISKKNAFSADVEKWFDRSVHKTFDNITYIILKEGQGIPLPDKSIDLVTCYQTLHHIRNIDMVLSELKRVCKYVLIVREHDCQTNAHRTLIDLEHSMYEISLEDNPNIHYLDFYEAWYRSKEEWAELFAKYNFVQTYMSDPAGPTRYYYSICLSK